MLQMGIPFEIDLGDQILMVCAGYPEVNMGRAPLVRTGFVGYRYDGAEIIFPIRAGFDRAPEKVVIAGIVINFLLIALPYFDEGARQGFSTPGFVHSATQVKRTALGTRRNDILSYGRTRPVKRAKNIRRGGTVSDKPDAVPFDRSKGHKTECSERALFKEGFAFHKGY